MSKLEDLLDEHTAEKVYEALVKAADEAEEYVNRVFLGSKELTQSHKIAALETVHFFRGYAKGSNPSPWPDDEE